MKMLNNENGHRREYVREQTTQITLTYVFYCPLKHIFVIEIDISNSEPSENDWEIVDFFMISIDFF